MTDKDSIKDSIDEHIIAVSLGRQVTRHDAQGHARRTAPEGVTFIVHNHNMEVLLPRAIVNTIRAAQVLRDEGISAEILVIDDGSRDGSLTLMRQLEMMYYPDGLRSIDIPFAHGQADSFNLGIREANYSYIVLMTAADQVYPANIPSFVKAIKETQTAVVYGPVVRDTGPLNLSLLNGQRFVQPYIEQFTYLALFDRNTLIDVSGIHTDGTFFSTPVNHELWLHLERRGCQFVFVHMPFGIQTILHEEEVELQGTFTRMFDQFGARKYMLQRTQHLSWHPELGTI